MCNSLVNRNVFQNITVENCGKCPLFQEEHYNFKNGITACFPQTNGWYRSISHYNYVHVHNKAVGIDHQITRGTLSVMNACSNCSTFAQQIDIFYIVYSRFERDWDHARHQDRGLHWFSWSLSLSARSGVRLRSHLESAGNFTTCTTSRILTNFVVNTCQNTYKFKVNLRPSCF